MGSGRVRCLRAQFLHQVTRRHRRDENDNWDDSPKTVLEMVDELLAPHGLEIVRFETGADDYLFQIKKRELEIE